MSRPQVCLTIGGSDSCGGAGIQADLRVFQALDMRGCSVVTALTAQSSRRIARIEPVSLAQLDAELQVIFDDYEVLAVKTGMLLDVERMAVVSACLDLYHMGKPLVVDPVMVASSGRRLLDESATDAMKATLLQQATLWTPNLDEAVVYLGEPVVDIEEAAQSLTDVVACPTLLKGGHGEGEKLSDVLCDAEGNTHTFSHDRQHWNQEQAHGSGCRLASAVTVFLAQGMSLEAACEQAIAYLQQQSRC